MKANPILSLQEDEFTCDDGTCQPLINRCDLKGDCTDRSDEVECKKVVFPGESAQKSVNGLTRITVRQGESKPQYEVGHLPFKILIAYSNYWTVMKYLVFEVLKGILFN